MAYVTSIITHYKKLNRNHLPGGFWCNSEQANESIQDQHSKLQSNRMKFYFLFSTILQFSVGYWHYSWPQSAITTFWLVLPLPEPSFSIFLTTSIPSTTAPKTTCFPSRWEVFTVQRKNCDPFVFLPALAMDRIPKIKKKINYNGVQCRYKYIISLISYILVHGPFTTFSPLVINDTRILLTESQLHVAYQRGSNLNFVRVV